jgi:carboxyl-terminal processing protease
MKTGKQRISLFAWIAVLILASLACSTVFGGAPSTAPSSPEIEATVENGGSDQSPTQEEVIDSPTQPAPTATESPPKSSQDRTPSPDLEEIFAPFWESWDILHEYFVEQPIDNTLLVEGAIQGLVDIANFEPIPTEENVAKAFSDAANTPLEVEDEFLTFWKVWVAAYGETEVALMRAALRGMIEALGDENTAYLDPDQYFQSNVGLDGTYEGIGAFVDPDGAYLTIISPIQGSPAEAAGLEPGDQIIAVDGEDMTGIDGNLVIRRVIGPAGSEVVLTIRRDGAEEAFDVTVVRAKINLPSLEGEILEENNLAYVRLFTFGATTGADLRSLLEELLAQNPDGLIFDLRGNGGGFLDTAIEVVSEFIDEGVVMYEVYGDGSQDVYESFGDGVATDIPLVVLVDGGSASASEIVAGAIQDYERGTLVGVTTFGKGSVQFGLPLSDQGAIRVTIAAWYTPDERRIHEIGLTPDEVVEITEAQLEAELDPQLDRAIEILTEGS